MAWGVNYYEPVCPLPGIGSPPFPRRGSPCWRRKAIPFARFSAGGLLARPTGGLYQTKPDGILRALGSSCSGRRNNIGVGADPLVVLAWTDHSGFGERAL